MNVSEITRQFGFCGVTLRYKCVTYRYTALRVLQTLQQEELGCRKTMKEEVTEKPYNTLGV
jgi:hypothetical protein